MSFVAAFSLQPMVLDVERWSGLWRRVRAQAPFSSRGVFDELHARLIDPTRCYHNEAHVAECLRLFDKVQMYVSDPVALELAIWFHDAIYDPRAHDNEECSARLAAEAINSAGGSPQLAARVHALIMTTRTHLPEAEPDAPWMIDIDLAILGAPAKAFAVYERAIRAEYAWVDATEFCAKRAAVLRRFLARRSIFLTPFFRARLEDGARANLRASIAQLDRGVPPGVSGATENVP